MPTLLSRGTTTFFRITPDVSETPPPTPETLVRPVKALLLLAVLLLPIFAHGCHGDDVDDEPTFVPVTPNVEVVVPN
jgi:hypothetical protein